MRPLAIALFVSTLLAQEYRGKIAGSVTDPSGSPVSNVRIAAVNTGTGALSESVSNESGLYQIPFLLPGSYRVVAEASGFKTSEWPAIRVATGAGVTLNISLELGAVQERVTVTAEAPLLNTSGADLGQVVDQRYVQTVAVALTRNAIAAARLAPGITGKIGTFSSNDQTEISISGGGGTQARNEFTLDGIPNTVPQGGGNIVYVPSLDTVEEIKVHTTMFDASLGHSNGGAVSLTTRGGANEYHGAAYLYKRWAALDANNWINNRLGLARPPISYRQWGATLGGPILIPRLYNGRNRTFFFLSREQDKLANQVNRQSRVPTGAERGGDFSQTLNRTGGALTLWDPATTVVTGNRAERQPFAANRIPAGRFDPAGVGVLKLYPLPNQSVPVQVGRFNWGGSGTSDTSNYNTNIRIDHALGERNRLFGRFSRLFRDQSAVILFPGPNDFPIDGTDSIAGISRVFHSFALDDTFVLSPSFTGSIRYGLSRRTQQTQRGAYGVDAAAIGVPDAILRNQRFQGYPLFRLGENMATIGGFFSLEATDQQALLATFYKQTGRHSTKFGVDYRLARWNRLVPGNAGPGDFTFNSVFTQQDPFANASADRSGTAMASLLLGVPASGSIGYASPVSMQNHYAGMFVQEDWKIHSRLTLNFGLRWEMETPWTERYDRISYGFDYDARFPVNVPGVNLRGGLLYAGVGGQSRRGGPLDANNFGPRFGAAWQVSKRTVVRAGYGLFYSTQSFNSSFLGEVDTFSAITPYVGTIDGGATPATTFRNPFPNGVAQPLGSSPALAAQFGNALTFYNPARVNPYNQQWQFSIQRELPSQTLVDIAYLGMLSLKQFESFNLNEKPDRFLSLGTAENTRVPNPFLGLAPVSSTLGQGATIVQSRLWATYPQFTNLVVQGENTGRAVYHALQWKVEKRTTRGLSFLWSHTFSKLMDNYTTSIVNTRRFRSVSEFDQTHAMRLAASYALPFRPANAIARGIVSGWEITGFWTHESGTPLSVTHANGRPVRIRSPRLEGSVSDRLGDRREGNRVVNPYFDIAAFQALPNQFTITPEPAFLAELRAPSARSLNLTVLKQFPIRERVKFQIRMDAIGATNSPIFGAPGTNLSNTATFGVINSAGGSRQMLGSARLLF
ncbi:MAG: TonB-dependent receptor [Bryobacterales bacterium]|nr:TonB-dependent receptor [Bryobacterales bacterium]